MTNEKIKTLADGYYAGNADWLNKEQEQDTKVGWRQGFAYALRQFAVSDSLHNAISEIENAMERWHLARDNDDETLEEINRILVSIGRLGWFNRNDL